jgi:hypothetical protein
MGDFGLLSLHFRHRVVVSWEIADPSEPMSVIDAMDGSSTGHASAMDLGAASHHRTASSLACNCRSGFRCGPSQGRIRMPESGCSDF